MLNKYARAFFTRVLTPFAAFLIRRGVSPDTVTFIGTAGVVAGALVFYPRGEFFWGTVVITLYSGLTYIKNAVVLFRQSGERVA